MSPPAIRVENLSKQYQIGLRENGYTTFREAVSDFVASPFRRFRHLSGGGDADTFWALKDVSFDVQPGEVVGIIGRNGAGKSTLLKVLSQITEPTAGRVEINGRVASLLEVGTGFHPELTGRENIFLNGAILGMTRAEIKSKFDEIVDFSGVERFLDTPVKRYSSGMSVRLAFAVAAHLEPEILIVDEVLAVGDISFQRKCMRRMDQVSSEGRTVLLVSHNLSVIGSLSTKLAILDRGSLLFHGGTTKGIDTYSRMQHSSLSAGFQPSGRTGDGPSRITNVAILDDSRTEVSHVIANDPFLVQFELTTPRPNGVIVGFSILNDNGIRVLSSFCDDIVDLRLFGAGAATCRVAPNCLAPGTYSIQCGLLETTAAYAYDDRIDRAIDFMIGLGADASEGLRRSRTSVLHMPLAWDLSTTSDKP